MTSSAPARWSVRLRQVCGLLAAASLATVCVVLLGSSAWAATVGVQTYSLGGTWAVAANFSAADGKSGTVVISTKGPTGTYADVNTATVSTFASSFVTAPATGSCLTSSPGSSSYGGTQRIGASNNPDAQGYYSAAAVPVAATSRYMVVWQTSRPECTTVAPYKVVAVLDRDAPAGTTPAYTPPAPATTAAPTSSTPPPATSAAPSTPPATDPPASTTPAAPSTASACGSVQASPCWVTWASAPTPSSSAASSATPTQTAGVVTLSDKQWTTLELAAAVLVFFASATFWTTLRRRGA